MNTAGGDRGAKTAAAVEPYRLRGRLWRQAALAILLSCLAARCFLAELPFRISAVQVVSSQQASQGDLLGRMPAFGELSRVLLAAALLVAGVCWMIGQARCGAVTVRRPRLLAAVAVFVALSAASAADASDLRESWTAWLEQTSLLGACVLSVQMFRGRRAMNLLLAVLAAVGLALAAKGLWQVTVEFPANIEHMQLYGDQALRDAGQQPGSPEAEIFRSRFTATTPYGYFNLSNPFGSLMIVLGFAAAGLAAAKLLAAQAARKKAICRPPPGQVHLPTLSGVLTAAAAAAVLAVLLLTRSRGAIAAAGAAAALAGTILLARRKLAKHWRAALLAVGACTLAAAATITALGLSRDRLPTRTMTFRWYYWTGSARIIADNPLLGVGGGNFPDAYLRHRRVEGEEAVKMPHNVVIHAAVQYGLAGGLCYVVILAWVLAAMARPRETDDPEEPDQPGRRDRAPLVIMALVAAGVLAARWAAVGPDPQGALIFLDVLCPAGVLCAALVLAWWRGGQKQWPDGALPAGRIILACGLAGFVLHNMVTFSLWLPSAALAFWLCAGACLARAGGSKVQLRLVALRWPAVCAAAAATVAIIVLICVPVAARWRLSRRMVEQLERADVPGAAVLAEQAARADPLDAQAAADAAKIFAHQAAGRTSRAIYWARRAIERNPASSSNLRLAAGILWRGAKPNRRHSLEYMAAAVDRNPMAARLRISYAAMLLEAGRRGDCLRQIDRALYIDRRLPRASRTEGSVMGLSPKELVELETLRRRASVKN